MFQDTMYTKLREKQIWDKERERDFLPETTHVAMQSFNYNDIWDKQWFSMEDIY